VLPERIRELIRADLPSLLALYRDLHAHPEISGEEAETAGRLAAALSAAGCRVTGGIVTGSSSL